jgi:hypothetical protein
MPDLDLVVEAQLECECHQSELHPPVATTFSGKRMNFAVFENPAIRLNFRGARRNGPHFP